MFNAKTNSSKNSNNQRSYVYQIGKGLLLFGGGILGYLGLSKIFSSGQQDEHNQVSTNEIVPYKSNKLTLSDFESTFEPTLLSTFNSNPAGRKLLSIDAEEEQQQSQQRRSGFTGIPGYRWTDEFQVNTHTIDSQSSPSIASLNMGGFVVTWNSNEQDGNNNGIFGQLYNSTGHKVSDEFQVNTYTTLSQCCSSVLGLADGGFLVTWISYAQNDWDDIYAQRYNAIGGRVGGEFQINTYTTSAQKHPQTANLSNDEFIVVWSSKDQDGNGYGIYGQRYNSTAHKIGQEFQINDYAVEDQRYHAVTGLKGGGFVVVWSSNNQDGSGWGIYGQRYNSAAHKMGQEFRVNDYTDGDQLYPAITCLMDGSFIVTWGSYGQDGSGSGVYGRRFNSNGNKEGGEFRVNENTVGDQVNTGVYSLSNANNEIIALWGNYEEGGYNIYGQLHNSIGEKAGAKFRVNNYVNGNQANARFTTFSNNNFVIVWQSENQDGSNYGIYGRIFIPILKSNDTKDSRFPYEYIIIGGVISTTAALTFSCVSACVAVAGVFMLNKSCRNSNRENEIENENELETKGKSIYPTAPGFSDEDTSSVSYSQYSENQNNFFNQKNNENNNKNENIINNDIEHPMIEGYTI